MDNVISSASIESFVIQHEHIDTPDHWMDWSSGENEERARASLTTHRLRSPQVNWRLLRKTIAITEEVIA